jgi:16S rRNA (guanine966-N2)-methyltransferase
VRIIAGQWRGRTISAPPGVHTRPTTDRVREAWMSVLQHDIPGARVLDLFAGSGALGLEALSRGAQHVTFVEKGPAALRALQSNIGLLQAGTATTVIRSDVHKYVAGLGEQAFDITLADPPYRTEDAAWLADAFLRVPFTRVLCIEHEAAVELAAAGIADVQTRRYGDTAITFMTVPA